MHKCFQIQNVNLIGGFYLEIFIVKINGVFIIILSLLIFNI